MVARNPVGEVLAPSRQVLEAIAVGEVLAPSREIPFDGRAQGPPLRFIFFLSLGAFACGSGQNGQGEQEDAGCAPVEVCPVPQAPALDLIHPARLEFTAECFPEDEIQVGKSDDPEADSPDGWQDRSSFDLSETDPPYEIKLFARVVSDRCTAGPVFGHLYRVSDAYPPAGGEPDSTAVAMDDPAIGAWATGFVEPVAYGEDVAEKWQTPERALGAATGQADDVVSLGRGGSIVLTFESGIRNGEGYDFAVFENASMEGFLELGLVEVSSDGQTFVGFDQAYLGEQPVSDFGTHDTALIGSLAGKYQAGWGTPFDLEILANKPEVIDGSVDLGRIEYVKIIDVVGDGSQNDSFGRPIYDPHPTTTSAGFDLDAIGVLNL